MFNLEFSIITWRAQMLAAGIQTPVPLDELEIHLRETLEQRMRAGFSAQVAFEAAAQQVGQPRPLNNEFKKTGRTFMNRKLSLLVGIFILIIGTTMILPALGKHKQRNQTALVTGTNFFEIKWAPDEVYGLELGTLFVTAGLATTVFGLKKRNA